ncbi:hypothetical protein GWM83_01490 [Candidatus Bathyarchaeota archaeon]|nr:hypothetical protein [Candidatus Bathyarchaeota archaeon]NIW34225.1 hypothetical protein [Candidatus Bathyarchaeota archaeon]
MISRTTGRRRKDKRSEEGRPPTVYETMLHYFPTEQVDIVQKMKSKRGRKKR